MSKDKKNNENKPRDYEDFSEKPRREKFERSKELQRKHIRNTQPPPADKPPKKE